VLSTTSVSRPSEAPYTAAPSPAGPPPTTTRSTSSREASSRPITRSRSRTSTCTDDGDRTECPEPTQLADERWPVPRREVDRGALHALRAHEAVTCKDHKRDARGD
jgi:hypothetical protein